MKTLLAACKANPVLPFMLLWQLAYRVPIKIALRDWWGLIDVFVIVAMTSLALVYVMLWVSVRDAKPLIVQDYTSKGLWPPTEVINGDQRRSRE